MRHDLIELRGTYRYPTVRDLERALADARARIDDDDHAELEEGWTRSFVPRGTTLRVDTTLPAAGDRYLAAAVLEALARSAVEGVVEARCAGRFLDWFPCGIDPDDGIEPVV